MAEIDFELRESGILPTKFELEVLLKSDTVSIDRSLFKFQFQDFDNWNYKIGT